MPGIPTAASTPHLATTAQAAGRRSEELAVPRERAGRSEEYGGAARVAPPV
jgi:hypothetical protein